MSENKIVGMGTSAEDWIYSNRLSHLTELNLAELLMPHPRVVIVSPHPDDEILGFGGLLQHLLYLDKKIVIITVTDGEGCYPGSKHWSPERLRSIRPKESKAAMAELGWVVEDDLQWHWLALPDRGVGENKAQLIEHLRQLFQPGDMVFTTWCRDGHADHEAVGCAVIEAAEGQVEVCEVPIWTWHWADPEDLRIPWHRACKLALDEDQLECKHKALHAFSSQLEGAPDAALPPILAPHVLDRARLPFEVIFL